MKNMKRTRSKLKFRSHIYTDGEHIVSIRTIKNNQNKNDKSPIYKQSE